MDDIGRIKQTRLGLCHSPVTVKVVVDMLSIIRNPHPPSRPGHRWRVSRVIVCVLICPLAFKGIAQEDSSQRTASLPLGAIASLTPQDAAAAGASVYLVRFSPSGRWLATRDSEQTVRVWDVASWSERFALNGHADRVTSITFSPDEKFIVTASSGDQERIHVWSMLNGTIVRKLPSTPTVMEFLDDGTLLSAADDGFLRYDMATGESQPVEGFTRSNRIANVLAISPMTTTFANVVIASTSQGAARQIQVRNWKSGDVKLSLKTEVTPTMACFSPDGGHLAVCLRRCNEVTLCDLSTASRSQYELYGHTAPVQSVTFSHDGRVLATASWDGTIRLWDVLTRNEIKRLEGHRDHVVALGFSPDGRQLASAASGRADHTMLVWDARQALLGIGTVTDPIDVAVSLQQLSTRDVREAYRILGRLLQQGDQTLAALDVFIKPLTDSLSDDDFDELIIQLNADSFQTRENAYNSLLRVRRLAEERLIMAMRKAPTLEMQLRLKKLLSTNVSAPLTTAAEYRRMYRIIQLLELFGNERSRALISTLATGYADARLSQAASRALQRLASSTTVRAK